MAPIAIDEGFDDVSQDRMNDDVHVEDIVVAGAGPAGLMLAYVDPVGVTRDKPC